MNFTMSDKQGHWRDRVVVFMAEHTAPAVPVYQQQTAPVAQCRAGQALRPSAAPKGCATALRTSERLG